MRKLIRYQCLSIAVYFVGFLVPIGILFIALDLLQIDFPTWISALMTLVSFPVSASIRIRVWKNRYTLLTDRELEHFGTTMYFALAPMEILVFVVGVGIILL